MYVFALWSECVLLHLVPLVQSQLFEFQPFPPPRPRGLFGAKASGVAGEPPDQTSAKILLKNLKKMLLHRVHLLYAFHGFLALHSIQHTHNANIEILAQDNSLRFVHICYIQIYTYTYIMKSHRRCTSIKDAWTYTISALLRGSFMMHLLWSLGFEGMRLAGSAPLHHQRLGLSSLGHPGDGMKESHLQQTC